MWKEARKKPHKKSSGRRASARIKQYFVFPRIVTCAQIVSTRCWRVVDALFEHHAWCRPFRAPPRELNMVASLFDVYSLPPPSHISMVVVQSSILSIVINPSEGLIEFAGLMACKLEIANARWGLGWVGRRTERIRLHWDEFFSSGAQLTLSTSY